MYKQFQKFEIIYFFFHSIKKSVYSICSDKLNIDRLPTRLVCSVILSNRHYVVIFVVNQRASVDWNSKLCYKLMLLFFLLSFSHFYLKNKRCRYCSKNSTIY